MSNGAGTWTMGPIIGDVCRGEGLGLCARGGRERRSGEGATREIRTRRLTCPCDLFFHLVVGSEQEARARAGCHQGEATEEGTEGSDEPALRAPTEELWHRQLFAGEDAA